MRFTVKRSQQDATVPPLPFKIFTGYAMPIEISGVVDEVDGGTVQSVSVTVTNADGMPATGTATKVGSIWYVLFAASNFTHYGTVKKGVRIVKTVKRADDTVVSVVVAIADLVIVAATASATAGSATASYVIRGEDVYYKTTVDDDGVQHYTKQVMEYDDEIGWGATWTGDYILVDSQFVEVDE